MDEGEKRLTLAFPITLWRYIKATAGERGFAAWVRQAAQEKREREEK